jgi:hypothetical protein
LVWKHAPHGVYTPQLGYIQLSIDHHNRGPLWWWKGLWKTKCPLNAKIFLWCMMNNKVPTWDNMKKRKKERPWWCILCKEDDESISHIFIFCPFTMQVWKSCSDLISQVCQWQGLNIEEAWRSWLDSGEKQDDQSVTSYPELGSVADKKCLYI